jgi:hypothetical protein
VLETVRGKTKPRIVTWLTWALLTGVAAAAAFSAGDFGSGFFALLGTIATSSIVVAGLRYGDRSFKALDIACMAAVVVGLVLWQVFNTPAIAVWAAIIVDCTGFVPTFCTCLAAAARGNGQYLCASGRGRAASVSGNSARRCCISHQSGISALCLAFYGQLRSVGAAQAARPESGRDYGYACG